MNRNREVWRGLIAVEGIDGAGTTTLANGLSEALRRKGLRCITGCEPTPGPIGRVIREALSGRFPVDPGTLALLFSADRREHLFGPDGIRSALDDGGIYLTDRYWFSSLAYQSLDSDWDWVDSINGSYPLPSHLIFLDLPVNDALDRISGRSERDIFETSEQQHRVAESYRRSIDAYASTPMKTLILDSRRSPEELCDASIEFVAELFPIS